MSKKDIELYNMLFAEAVRPEPKSCPTCKHYTDYFEINKQPDACWTCVRAGDKVNWEKSDVGQYTQQDLFDV